MSCSQCEAYKLELKGLEAELALAKVEAKFASRQCEREKVQKLGFALFLAHKLEKMQREYSRHKRIHTALVRVK